LVLVVLLIAAVIAAGALMTPDLSDARDRVDARWTPLREPLDARYQALAALSAALHDAGAGERAVVVEIDAVFVRWQDLLVIGPSRADAAREATTANELESLARRVRANIAGSDRLSANEAVLAAVTAFDLTPPAAPIIDAYNRAVRRYERERSGSVKRLLASLLGYESRPVLLVA
jgi:hypothetical protein